MAPGQRDALARPKKPPLRNSYPSAFPLPSAFFGGAINSFFDGGGTNFDFPGGIALFFGTKLRPPGVRGCACLIRFCMGPPYPLRQGRRGLFGQSPIPGIIAR